MGATAAEADEFLKAVLRVKESEDLVIEDAEPLPATVVRRSGAWIPAAASFCLVIGVVVAVSLAVGGPRPSRGAEVSFTDGRLLVAQDGKCVQPEDGKTDYDVRLVLAGCTRAPGQSWRFERARGNDYRLVNDHGRCLGAHNELTAYQGTKLDRVECQQQGHFFWRVILVDGQGDGSVMTLFNVGRKACLDHRDGRVAMSLICDQRPSQVFSVRA